MPLPVYVPSATFEIEALELEEPLLELLGLSPALSLAALSEEEVVPLRAFSTAPIIPLLLNVAPETVDTFVSCAAMISLIIVVFALLKNCSSSP